ncbi:MAG: hypothetical protein JW751_07750 [Polyangiaceae bacterium]|nr:hypothetical protein [Polyangiaceae bacterium]
MVEPRQMDTGAVAAITAAILLALPLTYVASLGPVAVVADALGADMETVKTFYLPVIWLHDHTPLREPLEWYADLWGI